MVTRYKTVNWIFNKDLFSEVVKRADDEMEGQLHEFLDVAPNTVRGWIEKRYTGAFEWPHMVNFLKVINLLDYKYPEHFFILEDV